MKKLIAKTLRVARATRGQSQAVFSEAFDINRSNYARMELKGVISADKFLEILAGLKLSNAEVLKFYKEISILTEEQNKEKRRKQIIKENEEFLSSDNKL